MATWEYKVEEMSFAEKWGSKSQLAEIQKFEHRLTELGSQGWELVNYEHVPMYGSIRTQTLKGHGWRV